jgi:Na+/melibiose symporter-like transporter
MAISTGIRRLSRSDYVKISLFGLAANALWQCLHIIIIPLLVLDFVGESQKNTYLGLLTFCGLFLAMVSQPIAGAFSDRHNLKWGKRRPYILSGGLIAFIVLSGFGLAQTYVLLLLTYCVFQIALNVAYGPYQAFIPDMVDSEKRGLAAGTKGLMEMLGVVVFIYPVSLLMDRYFMSQNTIWLSGSFGLLATVLGIALILTMVMVKERSAQY